jgi:hypothetical protein
VTATFTASGGGGTTTTSGALSGWYDFSWSYYFYHQGKNPTYTATVSPNVAGQQVLFTLQKKNSSGVWNTISTASFALNSSSAVAVKITGLGQGRYRVDASYAGDGSHFGSTSAWSNIKVTA